MDSKAAGELTQGLHRMVGGPAALRDRRYVGEDHSGAVRVILGASGNPVGVTIAPHWRGRVAELAEALRAALHAAMLARIAAWAQAFAGGLHGREPPASGPPPAEPTRGASAVVPVIDVADMPALSPLLRAAEAALETLATRIRAEPPKGIGRDPGRHVVVTVAGGDLTELRIDPHWMNDATLDELGQALHEALAAAFMDMDRGGAEAIESIRELREIRAMASSLRAGGDGDGTGRP